MQPVTAGPQFGPFLFLLGLGLALTVATIAFGWHPMLIVLSAGSIAAGLLGAFDELGQHGG